MSSTVKAELDKANPVNLADLLRLLKVGKAFRSVPKTEQLTVSSHLATPTEMPGVLLDVFVTAAGANHGESTINAKDSGTPAAAHCVINATGKVQFAAADAVTEAEITYLPLEAELVEDEVIPVTAGGVGTFLNGKGSIQIVSAELNSDATTPGAKTIVARGTLVGALGAGEAAVQFDGNTIQFVAAEAGVICTATVSYYATPGVGSGAEDTLVDRLEATFTP